MSKTFFLEPVSWLLAWLLCFVFSATVKADNWPQWRGGSLDSVSTEPKLEIEWDDPSSILWRIPLPGPAGASPVVWGDQVFVCSTTGDDADQLALLSIGTDGKNRWQRQLKGSNRSFRDNANSASPSPLTDGEHVWIMTGKGWLECFTMSGEPVWDRDLQQEYGKFEINFGMSSTPVLEGGKIYLTLLHGDKSDHTTTSVGHVVALDADTGEQVWHHIRKTDGVGECKHSYASPTIFHHQQNHWLIVHGSDYITAHSLTDGDEVWRHGEMNPKGDNYNPTFRFVASPVCHENLIIVPSAKNGPVQALRILPAGNESDPLYQVEWVAKKDTPDVATPVVYEGFVYLARKNKILICLDLLDGKVVSKQRMFADQHRSTPVAIDGKVLIASRDGKLLILAAGPNPAVLATIKLDGEITSSPAIADGRIYVRTFKELVAIGKP